MSIKTCNPSVIFTLLFALLPLHSIAEPQRIISTDSSASNLLMTLGLSEELVAVDVTTQLPKGKTLANVGYHRNLSAEGLLSLEPTLVVGSEHMGPEATIRALDQAGVEIIQLPTAMTTFQLKENITQLAKLLGAEDAGHESILSIDAKLNQLKKLSIGGQTAVFLLSNNGNTLRAAGTGTGGAAFLKLLGADSIVHFENYRNLSAEALLSLEPDIIIIASTNPNADTAELIRNSPALELTHAAKKQKIIAVNASALIAGISTAAIDEALRISKTLTHTSAL